MLFLLILKMFSGMLGDDDEEIRRLAVNKIQGLQGKSLQHSIPNGNFRGGYVENCQNTEEYFKFPSSILMHSLFIKWSI